MLSCTSVGHAKHFDLAFPPLPEEKQLAKQLPGDWAMARVSTHAHVHLARVRQTL